MAGSAVVGSSGPASAADPLECRDALYIADNTSDNVLLFDLTTNGVVAGSGYDAIPGAQATANQNGISSGGLTAINTASAGTGAAQIVEYDTVTGTFTSVARPEAAGGVAGAINPADGLYHFGGYGTVATQTPFTLYTYDPATNTVAAGTRTITVANAPGGNGDLAFDSVGTMYFVAASATETVLYRANADDTATELVRTTGLASASNGIAFGSDGFLYLGRATELSKVNPITGAVVGSALPLGAGYLSTDLASCAGPSSVRVSVELPDGRIVPGDQFTVEVTGGDYDTVDFPSGLTQGSDTGVQDEPGEFAGPGLVLPGSTHQVTLSPAAPTDSVYTTSYECIDAATATTVASGPGSVVDLVVPSDDAAGSVVDCRILVEFSGPTAEADTATTPFDTPVTLPAGNDDTAGNTAIDQTATVFTSADATNNGKTLTNAEGTWTIDAAGIVSFTPNGWEGPTTPVEYRIADANGLTDTALLSVTVGSAPTAGSDAGSTPFATPVTVDVLVNDTGGTDAPLQPGSVVFTSPDAADGGKTLVIEYQGTWTIDVDDVVTFTPLPDFTGPADTVEYSVTDLNGTTATGPVDVTVGAPPAALPDVDVTTQNTPNVVDVIGNDLPGDDGTGDIGDGFDPASVVFPSVGQPAGSIVTGGGSTLTIDGEGTWTIDPDTGAITFSPEPTFVGFTSSVVYEATDDFGHTADSILTIEVEAIVPVADDDAANTAFDTPVTLPGVTDDEAGDPRGGVAAPLVPAATVFTATGQPVGAELSPDAKTLTVADQGTWTINADGTVTFVPAPGFTGPTTPVTYRISDANGTTDTALLTVTVQAGPSSVADVATTDQNVPVTLLPLGNDTPSLQADGSPGSFVPTTLTFDLANQPDGSLITLDRKTLTVDGAGSYAIAPDGSVTFTPAPQFRGDAPPVSYLVDDAAGNTTGSTMTVTSCRTPPTTPHARRWPRPSRSPCSTTTRRATRHRSRPAR
ncbi:MAG: cadherin-like domain-containing protein [Ilumatobacter sp.]